MSPTGQRVARMPDPFAYEQLQVNGTDITTAVAGEGEPLLLLHGYPQTHLVWRHVAPALAQRYTVVVTDLRGYGDSGKPAPDAEHTLYSKRALAEDQLAVMRHYGFERFGLVGHDRGARVAHRLTLDHPDAVTRLALLDIIPTRHLLTHVDHAMASAHFHWWFLAAGGGIPEGLLAAEPEFWIRAMTERLLAPGATIEPDVMTEYIRCFSDPATIAATCADYRAGAATDLDHDNASAEAGQKLAPPTLVLWGEASSFVAKGYEPMSVWDEYAADLRGTQLPGGHFLPEEIPARITQELLDFLS
ncbi:alpha/beta hydrolase [Streptomyces sp. NPDC006923]|uniref:alpha/beta fold hydrolase n=1 Tax=Streptomyces sp. NPDC006923 TaxID=3155355 RepID=UPI0033E86626